jgi:hypothetical protein
MTQTCIRCGRLMPYASLSARCPVCVGQLKALQRVPAPSRKGVQ